MSWKYIILLFRNYTIGFLCLNPAFKCASIIQQFVYMHKYYNIYIFGTFSVCNKNTKNTTQPKATLQVLFKSDFFFIKILWLSKVSSRNEKTSNPTRGHTESGGGQTFFDTYDERELQVLTRGCASPCETTPTRDASWRRRCAAVGAHRASRRRRAPQVDGSRRRRRPLGATPTDWRPAAAESATGSCWGWLCAWAPLRREAAPPPASAATGTVAPPRSDQKIAS